MPKRHNHRQSTSIKDFRRNAAKRAPRPLILIVCEGAKTEHLYFDAIRTSNELTSVSLRIVEGAGQNMTLVRRAIAERKRREQDLNKLQYDAVWCVFDREAAHQNDDFMSAVELALRSNLQLAISNPCFEYWYLLHFQKRNSPFHNAKELKRELNRYIHSYYEAAHVYKQLSNRTEHAIKHAEQLYEVLQNYETDPYPNPSTTVYKLVRRLVEQ